MALSEHSQLVRYENGVLVKGKPIGVFTQNGQRAPLFRDLAGTVVEDNPTFTNRQGVIQFYISAGTYDLHYPNGVVLTGGLIIPNGDTMIEDIEDDIDALKARADALEAFDVTADTRLDALEDFDVTADTRLDALEAFDVTADSRLDSLEAADTALDSRVDALEATLMAPVETYTVRDPDITATYSYVLNDAAGVAAANNFVALFNPAASGKVLRVFRVTRVNSVTGGAAGAAPSMRITRITTSTGGSLVAASSINKFDSTQPDPVAQVRITNPSVTAGAIIDAGSSSGTTGGTPYLSVLDQTPDYGSIILRENEGIVLTTPSGDTDQTWVIGLFWGEV